MTSNRWHYDRLRNHCWTIWTVPAWCHQGFVSNCPEAHKGRGVQKIDQWSVRVFNQGSDWASEYIMTNMCFVACMERGQCGEILSHQWHFELTVFIIAILVLFHLIYKAFFHNVNITVYCVRAGCRFDVTKLVVVIVTQYRYDDKTDCCCSCDYSVELVWVNWLLLSLWLQCGVDVSRFNSYEQTALDIVKKFTSTHAAKELKTLLKGMSCVTIYKITVCVSIYTITVLCIVHS